MDLLDMDPKDMCRTCTATATDMRRVFDSTGVLKDDSGNIYMIYEIVEMLTGTTVLADDGLPQNICRACIKQFFNAFNCVSLAKKIDTAFRKYLGEINPDIVMDDEGQLVAADEETVLPPPLDIKVDLQEFANSVIEKTAEEPQDDEDALEQIPEYEEDQELENYYFDEAGESKTTTRRIITMSGAIAKVQPKNNSANKKAASSTTTEEGGKAFQCQDCNKTYSFVQALNRHRRQAHTVSTDQKKRCTYCDRLFDRADVFTRHIRTHTNERPFPCLLCDKRFKQNCELKEHQKIHTKTDVFTCEICSRVLTTRMGFYCHMKGHSKSAEAGTDDKTDVGAGKSTRGGKKRKSK